MSLASVKSEAPVRGRQGKKGRGRPTQEESIKLRETIARCALEAFVAHGFEGASIDAIARAADVSKVTVYKNFENKENLFIQANLLGLKKLNFQLGKTINYRDGIEVVLRRIVIKIYRVISDPEVSGVVRMAIFEGRKFPAMAEREFRRNMSITLSPLIEYLRWVSEQEGWEIPDPKKAALQLSALTHEGVRVYFEVAYRTTHQIKQHADDVVNLLIRAWKVTPPGPGTNDL